jgi:cellulose synthase/poly-beta-1,6-N-acetylglucosamine synthase-like glycosyltransferase
LSQCLLQLERLQRNAWFSIGICAADHATEIEELISIIERERYPTGYTLKEIIIVASGVDSQTMTLLRRTKNQRENIVLIEEKTREGKAEAINRIIERFTGEFLVLINSDAHPAPHAISKMINAIASDSETGMVSASPVLAQSDCITGSVLRLMWELHNECLDTLNEHEKNNHCCDELVIIRSEALRPLPEDTINDGAFLAGSAYRAGYRIRFCREAKVRIEVPQAFSDLMRQRRRIVYGHMQIHRSVGQPPRTLESMIFNDPRLALSILTKTLAKSPRLILILPVALVGEFTSTISAALDRLGSTTKHVPWDRVGKRA